MENNSLLYLAVGAGAIYFISKKAKAQEPVYAELPELKYAPVPKKKKARTITEAIKNLSAGTHKKKVTPAGKPSASTIPALTDQQQRASDIYNANHAGKPLRLLKAATVYQYRVDHGAIKALESSETGNVIWRTFTPGLKSWKVEDITKAGLVGVNVAGKKYMFNANVLTV